MSLREYTDTEDSDDSEDNLLFSRKIERLVVTLKWKVKNTMITMYR